ncbi:type II toxin-antitoxin system RelE/ParE family toxin [Galbibacter mesophilus]|uniref:type II toxin-antitoxin system RelE/ParE family toxin n=1 Tax=Galbibacter mesophilus TaxID=379069 RepID=UPI00191F3288|nr:type II toxin-antitoxin system RelE/ParE family toxin [Galbibacter mesophilus]MCM5664442.1 type II toxin-antitoxin system RelE/ParE family toxin [Galbibacter mesophilus]
MKVFLSELAEKKLLNLSEYLLENWGLKTRNDFISKLTEKIQQITNQPESCPKSSEIENLYKCVVTKQTTFYYRIKLEEQEIEIITIFDTRQNPNKLKRDID